MKHTKSWHIRFIMMLISVMIVVGSIAGLVLSQDTDDGTGEQGEHQTESNEGEGDVVESASDVGGEEAGMALAPNEIYDEVHGGARLILVYDAAINSFIGTVENTTDAILQQVRVEVHLSNGLELGPTIPIDLAPGEQADVMLSVFDSWTAHAEVGIGEANHGTDNTGREEIGKTGEHSGGEKRAEHGDNKSEGD